MSFTKRIGFLTAFIIPTAVIVGFYLGGWANFITPVLVFVLIPSLDYFIGKDPENVTDEEAIILAEEFYYRLITFVWAFFQVGFVVWGAYVVSAYQLTNLEWVGFVLSFALVTGGIGITVAHELGHKKSKVEQFYSKLILMTVGYMHFFIEHNKGHHVYVATPRDPATSRKNENFYAFWLRSVFNGYSSAWQLEFARLKRKGFAKWGVKNQMIWFAILPVLFTALLTVLSSIYFGVYKWEVIVFMTVQSILAFSLLEIVNYIEHYGIVRKEVSPGRYETVTPMHSWNANHRLSNFFLFQLQRHSDHHANAFKRYQVLKHYDESPQLPSGYPSMIMLASFPPLWFKLINPRLKKWEEKVYSNRAA